ncbi:Clp protease N-terminal domain-containing protein [Modestobacter sp. I12A-02662]|uniref:Clp protease N-terminal domain-containing protein n=1 Tax=Modestobacter sp. I12A-02662 TaxID=1730496 RepID=UPI0034DF9712
MFERFTQEARRVVVGAQAEARELRAEKIEPVHLLLALTEDDSRGGAALRSCGVDHESARSAVVRAGSPLDADALAAFGIDLEQVRAAAEAAFGPGALEQGKPEPGGHIPFADGSKRALEESLRAVLRRGRRRGGAIDSGHVLLGVLAVADPLVQRVLAELGVARGSLEGQLGDSSAA